jgi:hypothetical protein
LNYKLDARLSGLARTFKADYTRYADDLTFSFAVDDGNACDAVEHMIYTQNSPHEAQD